MKKVVLIVTLVAIWIRGAGQVAFEEIFSASNLGVPASIQQSTDGGYVLVGTTTAFGAGGNDIYLVKTNAYGNIVWSKSYGNATGDESATSVSKTIDGGYIIEGISNIFGAGNYDIYVVKIDSLGNTLWSKTYGGTNDETTGINSIQQTSDGGYILVGSTKSFGRGWYDVYLIKTNNLGDTLWTRTFGDSNYNMGRSVKQTNDGGYIIMVLQKLLTLRAWVDLMTRLIL